MENIKNVLIEKYARYKYWNRTTKNFGGKRQNCRYDEVRNKRIWMSEVSLTLTLHKVITCKLCISMTKWECDCRSNLQYSTGLGGESRGVSLLNPQNGMCEVTWCLSDQRNIPGLTQSTIHMLMDFNKFFFFKGNVVGYSWSGISYHFANDQ